MLTVQKNLTKLNVHLEFPESIYIHKKWESKMSDLLGQLLVLIKLNHNLIMHNTLYMADKETKQFSIFFRREDNKDIFSLHFNTTTSNELNGIHFKNYNKQNVLSNKIKGSKTIKLWTFVVNNKFDAENYDCRTIKSSVEFLEQLVKYV